MSRFHCRKVLLCLPGVCEANTVYAVRAGAGFDFFITDVNGLPYQINRQDQFLGSPDLIGSTDSYFTFGWSNSDGGGWVIHRQDRAQLTTEKAFAGNNMGYADLTDAWASRDNLVYV